MAETKNIYARIQQSRVDVLNEIKKGTQGYGYSYFSNDDILPVANEVLNKNGLCPLFKIEKRRFESKTSIGTDGQGGENETNDIVWDYWGVLDIFNIEDPKQAIRYEIPTCLASVKGASAIQNFGAMQTFVKRYLYLSFLEIADGGDKEVEISSDNEKKASDKGLKKANDNDIKATPKQIEMINSKLEKGDLEAILDTYNVKKLEDLTIAQASDCLRNMG